MDCSSPSLIQPAFEWDIGYDDDDPVTPMSLVALTFGDLMYATLSMQNEYILTFDQPYITNIICSFV